MFLVIQHQGERWHPVGSMEDPEEIRNYGAGEFEVWERSDTDPPKMKLHKRLVVTVTKNRVKEI